MNKHLQHSILASLLTLALLLSLPATAQEAERTGTDQIIKPEVDRRLVSIPRINVNDLEAGVFFGLLSVEDFGVEPVYGIRLTYHVAEDYFVEGMLARSSITDQAFFDLGLSLLPERTEDLTYYSLSVGYNLFPAEIFFGRNQAWGTTVYLVGGVGNTSFIDENHFTLNLGMGLRILPRDGLAMHIVFRDHLFESDIIGTKELKNNFELTFGMSMYF